METAVNVSGVKLTEEQVASLCAICAEEDPAFADDVGDEFDFGFSIMRAVYDALPAGEP